MEVKSKSIYLISGHPKHGKTTIASNFDLMILSLDELFWIFYNKHIREVTEQTFSIYDVFKTLNQEQLNIYKDLIFDRINDFISSELTEFVIEGWLLSFLKESIKKTYPNINFCDIIAFDYCCYTDGIKFENKDELLIKENIVTPLKKYFYKRELLRLNVSYHYFEDIRIGNQYQNSLEKYNRFTLTGIENKTILDVGCNTGYNVIKMASKAAKVIGLDNNHNALKTASYINNLYYKKDNLKFIFSDFLIYKTHIKFDIILASSIFHYFVGKQQQFINKCYELLNDNGILVLECGILTTVKPNRLDCEYTSKEKLMQLCKDFECIYEGESVMQAGDNIQRYVFHFKKK